MSAVREVPLSPAEIEIATGESPSVRAVRLQLEDQLYEAEKLTEWFQHQISTHTTDMQLVGLIRDFADWSAKRALIRDRLERFGFRRRLDDAR